MAHFRLTLSLIFSLAGLFQIQAQKNPVFFAGFDYYRHSDFTGDSFANINGGIQLYQIGFFVPEIGYDLFWGHLEDRKNYTVEGDFIRSPDILERDFNTSLFTLSLKLKFGNDDAFLTLGPKFHTGKVTALGNYYVPNEEYNRYDLEERQRISSRVSFWSFSIGFEAFLFETDRFWFTFFLNYTNLDAGAALSNLDFSHYGEKNYSGNTSTVGLGLRFNYNPFSSEND